MLEAHGAKSYRILKNFIFTFLIFYFIAGLSTEILLPGRQKDIPPFFSWFLFNHIPQSQASQQAVRILEYQGKTFDPPVYFNQAYGVVEDPRSAKARELIRRLAGALLMEQKEESERLRRIFEQVYLPSSVRYDVVVVTYDPREQLLSGKSPHIRKLGEFTTGMP